jgi:hypothetical protein
MKAVRESISPSSASVASTALQDAELRMICKHALDSEKVMDDMEPNIQTLREFVMARPQVEPIAMEEDYLSSSAVKKSKSIWKGRKRVANSE